MNRPLVSRLLALILCAALTACGGRISAENRASLRTVQMVTPPTGAEATFYADRTSAGATMAGTSLGLVGGLIAAGIVAANTKAGLKRWDPVLAGRNPEVLAHIRSEVEKQFTATAGVRFAATGDVNGKLVFKNLGYGILQDGGQDFMVHISASVEMQKPGGEVVWQCVTFGSSTIKRTLEQYQQEPASFSAAIDEAANAFAKNLLERY